MINRLLLDLRNVSHKAGGSATARSTVFPELAFASNPLIGNLGAPLRESNNEAEEGGDDYEEMERDDGVREILLDQASESLSA